MARVQVGDETWSAFRTGLRATPVSVELGRLVQPEVASRRRRSASDAGDLHRVVDDARLVVEELSALITRGRTDQRCSSGPGAAARQFRRTVRLIFMYDALLTVPQVGEEFQMTAQTIRNWIDQGVRPAVRVGRAFRFARSDVDALLDRAKAESDSLATQRGPWSPEAFRLTRQSDATAAKSVWDDERGGGALRKSAD